MDNCTNMDIAKLDTSNVTNMNSMFYNCSSLTELDISTIDMSKATDVRYMFHNCSGLLVSLSYSSDEVSINDTIAPSVTMRDGTTNYTVTGYEIISGSEYIALNTETGVITGVAEGEAVVKVKIMLPNGTTELFAITTISVIDSLYPNAPKLTGAGSVTVSVSTSNYDYYSSSLPNYSKIIAFKPAVSGTYIFEASSSIDTYGRLYDENMNSLTVDDDGGSVYRQFKMTYTCTAGKTYYIAAGFYSSSNSGTIPVTITKKS